MSFETLADALLRQREYSDLFFKTEQLTVAEKEEYTKTFALALHAEVSDLVSAVNFKDHRKVTNPVDHGRILYKSVDAFRYILAILNLWNVDPDTFSEACEDKDLFLHRRHSESIKARGNKPVVIFDVDDVIAEFRSSFTEWLDLRYKIKCDPNDTQYYSAAELKSAGIETETAFDTFIREGGFRHLGSNDVAVECMRMCQEAGYWVQLLTARPASNLKCFYDTYRWLHKMSIPYDSIAFSPEKFLWVSGQEFYSKGEVVCALDDSTKHAAEYAKHGIAAIAPAKPYNRDVIRVGGISRIDFDEIVPGDLFRMIEGHRTGVAFK